MESLGKLGFCDHINESRCRLSTSIFLNAEGYFHLERFKVYFLHGGIEGIIVICTDGGGSCHLPIFPY